MCVWNVQSWRNCSRGYRTMRLEFQRAPITAGFTNRYSWTDKENYSSSIPSLSNFLSSPTTTVLVIRLTLQPPRYASSKQYMMSFFFFFWYPEKLGGFRHTTLKRVIECDQVGEKLQEHIKCFKTKGNRLNVFCRWIQGYTARVLPPKFHCCRIAVASSTLLVYLSIMAYQESSKLK